MGLFFNKREKKYGVNRPEPYIFMYKGTKIITWRSVHDTKKALRNNFNSSAMEQAIYYPDSHVTKAPESWQYYDDPVNITYKEFCNLKEEVEY